MFRVLSHIISATVALAIIRSVLQVNILDLLLLGVWWAVGIYAAVSHTRWTRGQAAHPPIDRRVWVFYLWYSLNGLVLLIKTKSVEVGQFLKEQFPSSFDIK